MGSVFVFCDIRVSILTFNFAMCFAHCIYSSTIFFLVRHFAWVTTKKAFEISKFQQIHIASKRSLKVVTFNIKSHSFIYFNIEILSMLLFSAAQLLVLLFVFSSDISYVRTSVVFTFTPMSIIYHF